MTDAMVFTRPNWRPGVAYRLRVRAGELAAWLALIAGIGLQAVVTSVMGLSLTASDSLLMLVVASVICTLLGAVATPRSRHSLRRDRGARELVWMNVWTAVSFVAFFVGVAVDGAAVVFTLEASFAPLGVLAWTVLLVHRGGPQLMPGASQWWPACLLAVVGMSLVAVMAPRDSGERVALMVAAMLGIVAGVAAGGLVIVSRNLGRNGVGVGQVMAHRFYATGTFAVLALLTLVPCGLLAPPVLNVGLLGMAASACIVAPLFLLQYAMQRLAPVSVTAALATMPAIAMVIELASGRAMSSIVLLLGALIVPGNLALLMAQQQRRVLSRFSALSATLLKFRRRIQPAAPSHSEQPARRKSRPTAQEKSMIVLVDPVSTGPVLSAALVERGEDPLHLYGTHLQEAYARDSHANKWLMSDPHSAAQRLSGLPVRAVIAASEWGVTAANHLSHALGLPHHLNSRVRARRDKAAMNNALQRYGLPAARTVYVRDRGEIASALAGFEFPVIVKPVDSAGADGCLICAEPAQVRAAVRAGLGKRNMMGAINPAMLIQEYLDGPQFIVNTVSLGGQHLLSDMHTVRIDHIKQRPVLRHSLLITDLDEQADSLVAFTRRCLDAVGVREGAAHTEVRMTSMGPRLIEVNARLMGASQQTALYRGALGYNQADLVAERFTDPDAFANRFADPYAPAASMAMAFLNVADGGTVLASPGIERVRALPGFHSMEKMPAIGATIGQPWLCTGEAGMAYFLHPDREALADSLRELHRLEDAGELHLIRPHGGTAFERDDVVVSPA